MEINFNLNKNNIIIVITFVIFITSFLFIYLSINKNVSNKYLYIRKGPDMNYNIYTKSSLKLKNGNTLIIGNDFANNNKIEEQKTAQIFDFNDNRFIILPKTNFVHNKIAYLFEKNNKVLILDNNPVEIYDINNNKFIKTNLCIEEDNCYNNQKSLTTFKAYNYDDNNFLIYAPYSKLKLYLWNYNSGKTSKFAQFNIDRTGYNILNLGNKKIVILGGYKTSNKKDKIPVKEVEVYDYKTNKFIIIPNLILDSEVQSTDDSKQTFQTKNYEYQYDNKKNNFIKKEIIQFDKKYRKIKLNEEYILLIYTKCNILFCKPKSKVYVNTEQKIHPGPDLLYWTINPQKIINTKTNSFILYGSNYETNLQYPVKYTQEIIINKR